jgi:hypothetical protein
MLVLLLNIPVSASVTGTGTCTGIPGILTTNFTCNGDVFIDGGSILVIGNNTADVALDVGSGTVCVGASGSAPCNALTGSGTIVVDPSAIYGGILAANLIVASGSVIRANGSGCGPSLSFDTTTGSGCVDKVPTASIGVVVGFGEGSNSSTGAGGGGHGGAGGSGLRPGGYAYGSSTTPAEMGSGGGSSTTGSPVGGSGGGGIYIDVTGTLTNNGTISSNGTNGVNNVRSTGGGSGGGIYVITSILQGSGSFQADGGIGGDGGSFGAGGGGGGRIAVYYTGSNTFVGTFACTGGAGGGGTTPGGGGSPGTCPVPASTTFTTTLGDGADPADSTVPSGSTDQFLDQFTLATNSRTDTVTGLTVTTTNTVAIASMKIMSDDMTTQYFGTVSSPTGDDWIFGGGSSIPVQVKGTADAFRVVVDFKTRAQLAPILYPVTGRVTSFSNTSHPQAGSDTNSATITVDNAPLAASAAAQRIFDGVCDGTEAQITEGNTILQQSVCLSATVSNPVAGRTIQLQVEVKPFATPFDGTGVVGSGFLGDGSTATVTVGSLAYGTDYHWRYRAVDSTGRADGIGAWTEFGTPGNVDFTPVNATPAAGAVAQRIFDGVCDGTEALITEGAAILQQTVCLSATVSDANNQPSHTIELQVEVKPFATPFDGTGVVGSGFLGDGSTATVTVGSLAYGTDYHWRYRAVDSTGRADGIGAWTEFGTPGNVDFTTPVNAAPTAGALAQRIFDGRCDGIETPVSVGGNVDPKNIICLEANVADTDDTPPGQNVRLEIEVRPMGLAFTNSPTHYNPSPTGYNAQGVKTIMVGGLCGYYHWQARAVDDQGLASGWTSFGANPESDADFGRRLCGTDGIIDGNGDNIYGAAGSGSGGQSSRNVAAGVSTAYSLTVQNDLMGADTYSLSWSLPAGWTGLPGGGQVVINDGSADQASGFTTASIPGGGTAVYTMIVTPPPTETQTQNIIIDIVSTTKTYQGDSVKAIAAIPSATAPPVACTGPAVPSASCLAPGAISSSQIKVYWMDNSDNETGFRIERAARVGGACDTDEVYGPIYTLIRDTVGSAGTGQILGYTDGGLAAATAYCYRFQAYNSAGDSAYSASVTATTLATTETHVPGAVEDLMVEPGDQTQNSIMLSWTAPSDDDTVSGIGQAGSYDLRYATGPIVDGGADVGQVNFSAATSVSGVSAPKAAGSFETATVSSLTPNTIYYFALKSTNTIGTSAMSNLAGGDNTTNGSAAGRTALRTGFNLISIPLQPPAAPTCGTPLSVPGDDPACVFEDDIGAVPQLWSWKASGLGIVEGTDGCYDQYPGPSTAPCADITTIVPGQGYFIQGSGNRPVLDVPTASTPVTVGTLCGIPDSYAIPLQLGWNIIGDPFSSKLTFSTVYVRQNGSSCVSFATAVANGWVGNSVYEYNGSAYNFILYSSAVMESWKGYWLWVRNSDLINGNTYELIVPTPP